MDLLRHLLLVVHLLSWAVVLGGVAVSIKRVELPSSALHGVLGALVTGVAMVGIASADDDGDVNTTKVAVKLVVALAVTALVVLGRNRAVTRALLGSIAGLVVLNVAIAVLWR